jgi:RNA polymerase sigma factor (sigma-70 family)
MAAKPLCAVVRYLHGAAGSAAAEPSDGELLERFTIERDPSALEALVRRHERMVMNVCRRLLGPGADADDCFQATFFVFARKARSIRKRDSVASWLHGVAHRLSRQLLGKMSTRQRCEAKLRSSAENLAMKDDPVDMASMRELGVILDDELRRLPAVCRAALIACHLEGLSSSEAAERLGVPASTLKSRLRRGRELLRQRLCRRGVGLTTAALTVALGEQSRAGASPALLQLTVKTANCVATSGTASLTTRAGALACKSLGVGRKLKLALLAMLTLALVGLGAAFASSLSRRPASTELNDPVLEVDIPDKGPIKALVDLQGDPLPPGAVMRLGTARLRQARGIEAVAFTPDSKQVVSVGDHKLFVWDAATGKELRKLEAINVMGMTVSRAAGVVAVAANGTLDVWDVATWERKFSHQVTTFAVAISPDGSILASGGRTRLGEDPVVLWEPRTGKKLRTLAGNMPQIFRLAFSPDGKTLAAASCGITAFSPPEGSRAEVVRLWNVETGQLQELSEHKGGVTSLAFSPKSNVLATGGHDGTLILWDTATRKQLHKVQITEEPHPDRKRNSIDDGGGIRFLAYAPDGKTIASANHDATVRFHDGATGKELRVLRGHAGGVCGLAYSPDGKLLASCSSDQNVRLWDAATGEQRNPRPGHDCAVGNLLISPDGKRAMSAGGDRTVRIWDLAAWKESLILRDFKNAIHSLALSPDGSILAVGMQDGVLQLRDAASGEQLRELKGHTGQIRSLSFSFDGKLLASAAPSGKNSNISSKETARTLRLWDVKTGQEVPRIDGNRSDWYARFSPDGKWLASYDRGIDLWDATTGKKQQHFADLCDAAFLPDSKRFAAWSFAPRMTGGGGASFGTDKGKVQVRSVLDGAELYSFEGPERMPYVEGLFVPSPDGRLLALAVCENSFDPNVLQLWEMATGKLRRTLKGHAGEVNRCVFSSDGRRLLSASSDTTVLVWDLGLPLEPRPKDVDEKALASLWRDLGDADAGRADQAIWSLVAAPKQALPFLQKNLPPLPAADPAWRNWVKDLGSDKFAVRDKASRDLEALEEQAYPLLKEALTSSPPLETRQRIERLLDRLKYPLTSSKTIRALRAVEVLERIGTEQARQVLHELAQGSPGARLTDDAKASLERLRGRR